MTSDQHLTNEKTEKTVDSSVSGKSQDKGKDSPKFPRFTLTKVLQIAESVEKNNAGKPYDRLDLAKSLDLSPAGSPLRMMITSSSRYGLTEGNYNADKISLTILGSAIVAPTSDKQKGEGIRQALLTPDLFRSVYNYFDKKQIPREELFKNTLKKEFNVDPDDVNLCYEIINENIKDFGLTHEIKGNIYLQLDKLGEGAHIPTSIKTEKLSEVQFDENTLTPEVPVKQEEKQIPKQIFVAHGKNIKPLEQLKAILTQFKIPFQVAIDDAHKGRPISAKVAQLMKECTSGIFIFTADEETIDQEGKKVLRPSDNVVFELGAGTVLYGNKIVIFREEGVDFGSDFTDIGRITFEKDKLDAKSFELMKELISLGFLQVSPT